MLTRSLLRSVRRVPTNSSFSGIQVAQFGGGPPPIKLRGPNNPRGKNEWNVDEEETPPKTEQVIFAKFIGACCWLWIMISAYEDKGKMFGLYEPWKEDHAH
mmetsp:Transcript_4903/g.7476  ORF Transcript_4903/g.7476 Transcript_4903/m.7476 type:complete len:101 (-) Transcript_4903:130-432(-)|eukprot:CAMPEP_0185024104 /NCGR_PEP_ID=MMETSP1103-20130426/7017_1 /TAXON_ID=36769 /ORGANISM="Paraphysomonas bandaiensis, Strain Caron Lab Isolate" /LENGTH=100 /DNA_ID=CAMNT_0027556967 /DNA_START=39 /DNA_END=341 /DNA_ORIENTATION=-